MPSSPARRSDKEAPDGRRARGDATRARILRDALRIASVQGLDGVTVGQVAEASGVSKGHLAQLFGDREALQLATLQTAAEIFTERVVKHAEAAPTALEKLRRYCLGWFDYVEGRVLPGGCFITAASSEFRTIAGAVRDHLIAFRERRRDYLRTTIRTAAAENGRPARVDADDVAYRILAFQAGANVALFLDDKTAFAHARRATRDLIDTLAG